MPRTGLAPTRSAVGRLWEDSEGVGETGRREGWTVSDQNEWPKPGETTPGGTTGGTTGGQPEATPAPENPYAAPQQPNPYGQPQQPPYGQQNPYAAPQQQQQPQNQYGQQNPYGQQQPGQNPYGQQPQQQQPYAPAGAYGPTGYQPYAQRPKTNTLAILSIVFGLAAIPMWFIAILLGPAGAILGHVALGKIKQNGEAGRGLALTGIIAGWVMAGIWLIWVVFVFIIAVAGHTGYSDYGYDSGTGAFLS